MNVLAERSTRSDSATRGMGVRRRWHSRLIQSFPVQLVAGLLVAVILPALVRWDIGLVTEINPGQYPSVTGTSTAFGFGLLLLRRFSRFPGVQGSGYIVPCFLFTFGLLVLVMFFWRIGFARSQILGSFGMSIIWCYIVWYMNRLRSSPELAVAPFGSYQSLSEHTEGVRLHVLEAPTLSGVRADAVVADLRSEFPPEWERFLAACALNGTPVYHMKQVSESLTGRVRIEHLSENTLGALIPSPEYVAIKRILESGAVLIAAPLLLPVAGVIAIMIRLDSKGPVIFRQVRMGYRGKTFTMLKFRTMRDVPEGPKFTQALDPRVTRVGRMLRRYRLDELPQMVNILRGEMSLIGPRPESVELSEWYDREIPHYSYRHIVRPGITGWAQVQQGFAAEVEDVTDKLHYDFYYIKHFTPWLDLLIVLKTIHVMATGRGSR